MSTPLICMRVDVDRKARLSRRQICGSSSSAFLELLNCWSNYVRRTECLKYAYKVVVRCAEDENVEEEEIAASLKLRKRKRKAKKIACIR